MITLPIGLTFSIILIIAFAILMGWIAFMITRDDDWSGETFGFFCLIGFLVGFFVTVLLTAIPTYKSVEPVTATVIKYNNSVNIVTENLTSRYTDMQTANALTNGSNVVSLKKYHNIFKCVTSESLCPKGME